ncbi:MAG: hypothetical protein WAR78_13540, partial [Ferruginibacter sp.]
FNTKSRITNVQATVVQMLNQGTILNPGCNRIRVPFFGYILSGADGLGKQKSDNKKYYTFIRYESRNTAVNITKPAMPLTNLRIF